MVYIYILSLKLTARSSKDGIPKGNNRCPTINFQGAKWLVSGMVYFFRPLRRFRVQKSIKPPVWTKALQERQGFCGSDHDLGGVGGVVCYL